MFLFSFCWLPSDILSRTGVGGCNLRPAGVLILLSSNRRMAPVPATPDLSTPRTVNPQQAFLAFVLSWGGLAPLPRREDAPPAVGRLPVPQRSAHPFRETEAGLRGVSIGAIYVLLCVGLARWSSARVLAAGSPLPVRSPVAPAGPPARPSVRLALAGPLSYVHIYEPVASDV